MEYATVEQAFIHSGNGIHHQFLSLVVLREDSAGRQWYCGYVGILPLHGWYKVPYNTEGTNPRSIADKDTDFLQALSFSGDFTWLAGITADMIAEHSVSGEALAEFVEHGWFFGFADRELHGYPRGYVNAMMHDQVKRLRCILEVYATDVTFLPKTV